MVPLTLKMPEIKINQVREQPMVFVCIKTELPSVARIILFHDKSLYFAGGYHYGRGSDLILSLASSS